MNHLIRLKTTAPSLLMTLTLLYLGFLPTAHAVVPAPDGGYGPPAYGTGNTAEGQNALLSLTTGGFKKAVGVFFPPSDTQRPFHTSPGPWAPPRHPHPSKTAPS